MQENKYTFPIYTSLERCSHPDILASAYAADSKISLDPGWLQIPKELGQLTGLTRLDFSYNHITTIPDELGKLDQLYEVGYSK